jgi:hypothetical protein
VVVGGEVVEVAGVEKDVVMAEKVDGEVFVGGEGAVRGTGRIRGVGVLSGGVGAEPEDGVPAGVGVEEFAGEVGAELGLEVGAIFADAGEKLRAEGVALG